MHGEHGNMFTAKLFNCWNIRNRLYQKFRKRFDVQSSSATPTNKKSQRVDGTIDGSILYRFDDQLEEKNWRYHLTNRHF